MGGSPPKKGGAPSEEREGGWQPPKGAPLRKGGAQLHPESACASLPGVPVSGPLSGALHKILVFRFFDPGSGGPGAPGEAPLGYPWAFPGPPGAA